MYIFEDINCLLYGEENPPHGTVFMNMLICCTAYKILELENCTTLIEHMIELN